MTMYHVAWTIDIDAESPRDAAEQALGIQRDPYSSAVVFMVDNVLIDLEDPPEPQEDLPDA